MQSKLRLSKVLISGKPRPLLRSLIQLVVLVFTSIGPVLAANQTSDSAEYPPPGKMINVGAHRLHLHCTGHGTPAVIMDAGLGGNSVDWIQVQPALALGTRVCTYDRAGNGWSESGPLPRTSERIALELHALLKNSDVPPPYVLVGHSFGGYNMRMFANRYPGETAGLVLVDASHEDQYDRFREKGIGLNTAPRGRFILRSAPQVPAGMPVEARAVSQALLSRSKALLAVQAELSAFVDSAQQVRLASDLPDVPLVVITRGMRLFPKTQRGDRMERVWQELQDDLVHLTSHGSQVIAERSGHYVHLDEPGVVINGIKEVVHNYRAQLTERSRDTIPNLASRWYSLSEDVGTHTAALNATP